MSRPRFPTPNETRRRKRQGGSQHTLGRREVDDVPVLLEHVDLLNGLDGLDVQLLQRRLELLVIGAGAGGRPLDLAAGRSLATANALDTQSLDRQSF